MGKKICMLTFLLLILPLILFAKEYRLSWDLPATGTSVDGFVVYFSPTNQSGGAIEYSYTIDDPTVHSVPLKTLKIQAGIEYKYEVIAYTHACGASDRSDPVIYTVAEFNPPENNLPPNTVIVVTPSGVNVLVVNDNTGNGD